ncbi:metallophosphoesterase [Weizmannia acidilactici]|uniref:Metallophosphoesterase n=1 Tax=Weizmannia acidilactici TaxID=2607726 RepID=A0A5J4JDF2_9BACI|nr:metallophosphoesterase [Weizmannia acidilactici]GER66046.1 metallophosphoesterase [Weizmannia acidilactici]GER69319.1 metallophosphoesterase [Weizmannia acidilactici]GER72355.1 metallophosphoesterase [Weizmannia acidilactici]
MFAFLWIAVLCGIILLVYMRYEASMNRLITHEFCVDAYPDGQEPCTFFFISDIHRRKIHPQIVEEVLGKARFTIIGGDLLEKGVPLGRVEENLRLLKKIGPVFFVWGNNDYEIDAEKLNGIFSASGVHSLRNTAYFLHLGGEKRIALIGVDDLTMEQENLDEALEQVQPDDFRILISHNPKMVYQLHELDHIHVMLSGHTHGGQIRLFGISRYRSGGVRKIRNMIHLTSNGYGTTLVPLRLGAKPETHLITIKSNRGSSGL